MAASGGRGVKILPSMPRRRRLELEFRPLLRSHCDRRRQVPGIKMNNLKDFGMIENQNIQSSNVENWLAVCFIVNDPIKLFPNAFHWQRNELDLRIELFSSFNER